jgi:hypothetical protein
LITLRLELRCHCLQFLLPAIHKSNYYCDIDAVEADPYVVLLNKVGWFAVYHHQTVAYAMYRWQDLCGIDEALASCFQEAKRQYLFHGLDQFIAELLIRNLKCIRVRRCLGGFCFFSATHPWLPSV